MLFSSRYRAHLLLGSALLAMTATPALAQTTPASAPATPQDQTRPAPAPADSGDGLADIIVTATKVETNLQKTPISISVLTTQALTDRHTMSIIDLADGSVPGLRIATFESRQSALTIGIRGIVPGDANQTARDQGVGVYLDGVYLGRQQGLNISLLDIERIEVLKGPQGTLFGRNTEGGAVSIVTKAPSGEFDLRGTVGVGNYGSYNGQIHFNIPVASNLFFKVDGLIQHQDATTKNPLAGQTGWNYRNVVGGRIAARWQPFKGMTIDLAYDRSRDENTPFFSQLVNYNPLGRTVGQYDAVTLKLVAPGSPTGTNVACTTCIAPLSPLYQVRTDRQSASEIGTPQQPSVDRTSGFTGVLKYELTPRIELRSISSWRTTSADQWDANGPHRTTYAPNANFSRYSLSALRQNQFSQEFQLVGNTPQLSYALGVYYFTENVTETAATPSALKWNATGTGYTVNSPIVFGPITSSNQGSDRSSWFVQRDSNAKARSYAAFGQLTWTPAGLDDLHLTVGGRYTYDKRNGALTTVVGKPTNFPFTYAKGRIDPLVILAYDLDTSVHLYAKYSTGFRAGGANDRSQTFTAFGPEAVRAYEVGAKTEFWNRRGRLNLAAYVMNRTGTQEDFDNVDTNPASPTFNLHTEETRNAPGTSVIRGLEAELTLQPTDYLTLGASYAYTYTRVPAIPNPFLAGNPNYQVFVVYTPRNAASGYVDFNFPTGLGNSRLRLHVDANYASSQYSFQAESIKTDPSFIVNARVALADFSLNGSNSSKLTLSVWARNLLNESHIYRQSAANAATLGYYANFNAPRTFGAELGFKF